MTSTEFADILAGKYGITKASSKNIIKDVFATIKDEVVKGNTFSIIGFGSFKSVTRAARQGRNPQNPSQVINIPARQAVKFTAGKELKKAIANK